MHLCVFEDKKYDNLYPLTLLRPVFELKCGSTDLLSRILRKFENMKPCFFMRDYLVPSFKKRFSSVSANNLELLKSDDLLLVNGRWLITEESVTVGDAEEAGVCGGDIVYARVSKKTASSLRAADFHSFLDGIKKKIKTKKVAEKLINYPWELVKYNSGAIVEDFNLLPDIGMHGKFSPQAVVYGPGDRIFMAKTAEVQPFVVLDTTCGPITIDEGVIIYPYSRIEGPAYIGKGTHISGANIREGCSIGPVCRIGGEVEETIIHGYTNKFHDGFLGHSYLCEWINLGALTTNSDLKNDYSQVQVYVKDELVDSNEIKVGCFIGDHTKTGIGTFFNTGTVVGIMTNVIGVGILPKLIPSFCWFLKGRFYKGYGFKKMVETAAKVMQRRECTLTDEGIDLLKVAYDIMKEQRDALIKRGNKTQTKAQPMGQ